MSARASATRLRCPPESVRISAAVSPIPNRLRIDFAFVSDSHAPDASNSCINPDTRSDRRGSSVSPAANS
jgi:hypothetical protein